MVKKKIRRRLHNLGFGATLAFVVKCTALWLCYKDEGLPSNACLETNGLPQLWLDCVHPVNASIEFFEVDLRKISSIPVITR